MLNPRLRRHRPQRTLRATRARHRRLSGRRWQRLVPTAPGRSRLTPQEWDGLMAELAGDHPVTAEQESTTLCTWNHEDGIEAWRTGDWLVVPLPLDGVTMLIAGPGATLTPAAQDDLSAVLLTQEVRYLTSTTAALLAPLAERLGLTLAACRDDADYVYLAQSLARLGEPGTGTRGKLLRRLERRYELDAHPERAVILDGTLADGWARDHLHAVADLWFGAKGESGAPLPETLSRERAALQRWPRDTDASNVRVFCLSLDGRPAGVSVIRPMRDRTFMGVVLKTDHSESGASELMRRHIARVAVREQGPTAVWNVQQDDGVPNLRAAKTSYGPLRLEPKYTVVRP